MSEAESVDSSPANSGGDSGSGNATSGSNGNGSSAVGSNPAPASAPEAPAGGGASNRLGALAGANEAMNFIETAGKNKALKIRVDDRNSALLMAASLFLLLGACWMVGENPEAKGMGITVVILADSLCGLSILWYCISRFGFIRSIEPRYALLCWHLVLGTGVLFSFIATNIMLTLFTLSKMQTP